MPIDPSIIGNVMAPQAVQMPDVNAMMRTQTQGMENIYQIEAAREAQAKEDAKAQEDAVVKALFPAYSYVLETGDLAGGLEIAPAQYRDVLIPHIKALEGKSLPEIRAALTGSLVTSETGRALLENRSRAATLGVQQGQLDVSRQDLALRRQKQALDARGEGEWKWEEGVDANGNLAFAWVNPRTREVELADLTGGGAPGATPGPTPIPAPDVVTPRQPVPGAPAAVVPGAPAAEVAPGTAQVPAFRPKPKDASAKDLKEQEAKSLDLAAQMTQANKITDELDAKGIKTSDAFVSFTESLFAALPDAVGKNLAEQMRALAENLLPSLSADEQRLARAQIQFVDAILRSRSGAEIKTSEFPSMYRVFFPVEADENNPEIVADKKVARQLAVDTMRAKSGTLGAETLDRILRENGVLPPATEAPAAPGASFEGFEVLGEEPDQ
jgi:hypothetical protein